MEKRDTDKERSQHMSHETEPHKTLPLLVGQAIVSWPCHTDQLAAQGDIVCTPELEGVYSQECQVALSRIRISSCSRKLSVCPIERKLTS